MVFRAGSVGAVRDANSAPAVEGVETPSLLIPWCRSTLRNVNALGLVRAAETDLNVSGGGPGVVLSRMAAGGDGDDVLGCGGWGEFDAELLEDLPGHLGAIVLE